MALFVCSWGLAEMPVLAFVHKLGEFLQKISHLAMSVQGLPWGWGRGGH